jgi:hypothetical protein
VHRTAIFLTGFAGLLAAVLVGLGEFLLHYDPAAGFSASGYDFLRAVPPERATLGHFIAVFGATLYPVGCWHLYLMLKPAHARVAFAVFVTGSFGFMVGVVWIGSRASIIALVQQPESAAITGLIDLYTLRYETLLQVIRFTTLALSLAFVALVWSRRTAYPRWMVLFNPMLLIIASFLLFQLAPALGKYVMPIALNVAYFIFFSLSLLIAWQQPRLNSYS